MKVLIIEDEQIAAEKLEQMLHELDESFEVLAKLGSVKTSVSWLMNNSADLIFLDIQLSDGLSFSIFDQVVVNTPIVFTTAYDQYAIKAFELNSIAYLLKPIRKQALAESLKKYQQLKSAFSIDFESLLSHIQGKTAKSKKRFLIQIGEKIKKIETDDIAHFYVLGKGVYLMTFEGHSYAIDLTLDRLCELLEPSQFFRINRQLVVNMDAISNMTAYSRSRVKLDLIPAVEADCDTVVSIDRSANFKKWLGS